MDEKNTATLILRMKDLPHKVGLQPSTLYGLIAKGNFPPPFKLIPGGRARGWLKLTIDQWVQEQSTGSGLPWKSVERERDEK